jgi:hypothetical protein
MQFAHYEMQVTDAATPGIRLAGYLTIMFKEFMQRDQHGLKIERSSVTSITGIATTRANHWQGASGIACAYIAPTHKRITTISAVAAIIAITGIATGRSIYSISGCAGRAEAVPTGPRTICMKIAQGKMPPILTSLQITLQ